MTYLTSKEVFDTFRTKCYLQENYNFLAEDLEQLAQKMIEAAAPKIIAEAEERAKREERAKCVTFVRSLNHHVADALADFKGEV
jgi:hypothetical protein